VGEKDVENNNNGLVKEEGKKFKPRRVLPDTTRGDASELGRKSGFNESVEHCGKNHLGAIRKKQSLFGGK